jgi:hypothetical protein
VVYNNNNDKFGFKAKGLFKTGRGGGREGGRRRIEEGKKEELF